MSHFSSALLRIIDADPNISQRSVAEGAKMSAPQLSRYARGHSVPSVEVAGAIIGALPTAQERAELLVAFLRDMCPEQYKSLVTIHPAIGHDESDPDTLRLPEHLDPELRSMLEIYAQLGLRHTHVRDMMRSFIRLVAPEQAP